MKFMPYASFYLDNIDFTKNQVDIVYWNRDLIKEDLSGYNPATTFHEYRSKMSDSVSKWKKLRYFYGYRRFVKRLLNKCNYDFIVSLHTLPGLLIYDSLTKKYKKRYILDYRDSTFESNVIFRYFVRTLALNAKVVYVSSDGFRKFLPFDKVETITSHNILIDSLKHRDDRSVRFVPCDRIRISFWGFIRHLQHNKLLIGALANDLRFELHYYGREEHTVMELKKYACQLKAENIFFHGEYRPEERYDFACNTDIIHNSYNDANMRLAMGNKYYDALIFRVPQLCMIGSFMAERCTANKTGFALDPADAEFADKLFDKYKNLDVKEFNKACDAELSVIMNEYNYGRSRLYEIFNA